MASKEQQQKVGIPAKRRGQQMGLAGEADRNRERAKESPASRGRLKKANKMFADNSSQQISTSAPMSRTNSPSTAGMNSGGRPGETTGETVFKRRLKSRQGGT